MEQFILLNSYVGMSHFIFDVACSGSPLSIDQAKEKGLITEDQLRRHSKSSYTIEFFSVKEGDTITVKHYNEDNDPSIDRIRVFKIKKDIQFNTNIDNLDATGYCLDDYLLTVCDLLSIGN